MYEQIEKNTVPSEEQNNKWIVFEGTANPALRLAFVGNSMTLHGEKKEIGWHHNFGMAASSKENDYVHLVIHEMQRNLGPIKSCICNAAGWEKEYKAGSSVLFKYQQVRDFHPNILIMRLIENCSKTMFDGQAFFREYNTLVNYLADSCTKIILTTGFWKHPGDELIIKVARQNHWPCIYLGDLGEQDEMKAIGLFEHAGVANHPGDLGMKMIAERILFELLKPEKSKSAI